MSVDPTAILVPLDTSSLSERALPMASRLARSLDLPVVILAVVDGVVADVVTRFAEERGIELNESVAAYFGRYVQALAEEGVEAEFASLSGIHPAEAILEFCAANHIELIVMASHGYSGITRWLLGSITEKVLRTADVPVVVVPVRDD